MEMSMMVLVRKTLPFIFARLIIYALFLLGAFIFLGIMVGIGYLLLSLFGESAAAFLIVLLFAFLFVWGALKFVERYVLYTVKLGHVSVIVELLRNGKIPEGKGMVAYGKDQVKENFGASNVAFVVDAMVHGAVKQIQRWILRIGNVFSFIPGSQNIIGIINAIMSVSLNYIDESVMSYIFLRKSKEKEESVWQAASDGVVLYAQSWKGILKAAAGSVLFIYIFNIVMFLIFVIPLIFISSLFATDTPELGLFLGVLAVVGALVLTTVLKRALIDPIVTIVMVRSYQMSIRDLQPEVDLQEKLVNISPRFRRLMKKAEEEGNVA